MYSSIIWLPALPALCLAVASAAGKDIDAKAVTGLRSTSKASITCGPYLGTPCPIYETLTGITVTWTIRVKTNGSATVWLSPNSTTPAAAEPTLTVTVTVVPADLANMATATMTSTAVTLTTALTSSYQAAV
ncbi:hypothetical protein VSDG_03349 [Cytospora chrysosperma]|uniref:Uncharacterized protein n=1 Tax=Cytospora chrysosperma TaxID=252740 RepID=A0A423WBG4_CYTCH|nr:hypothetical protein VSDG_03349 [Valsa sordida]